ncbi:Cro/CI family transcriptional regulator [Cupriavidus sp. CV2]|uniref:transcriptional regulator n=1 Tax=Cupriavidus ulmosensis TaxID=3065913 RepID=UPI00296AEE0B|nr:Cro/CI family transcriptional regulator [Cupriavidus sp. CV2]MDW3684878.1 Cro/CI family transcriptional regulator [Cupriavidus sp. CV2]
MSPIERAIEIAGGKTKLARAIGVTPQMVSQWSRKEKPKPISVARCAQIEKLTGVPCEQLNPDEDWEAIRSVLCDPNRKPAA